MINPLTGKELEPLTAETYITNHDYLSYSRLCHFRRCEASAVAHYRGETTVSRLVGSYVDAYFSGELQDFKDSHLELFNSRTGELKKDYVKAEEVIKRLEQDITLMHYMSGESQKIMTGIIDSVPFKIKMDSYLEHEAIVDLKIMKDFKKVWDTSSGAYLSFVEAYDYDIELALFQEIVYQNTGERLPCYLVCATTEKVSDIGLFEIPQESLDRAMRIAKSSLPRYKQIVTGKVAPHRCEVCDYCKSTKRAVLMPYEFADYNGDQLREEGFECEDAKIKIKGE